MRKHFFGSIALAAIVAGPAMAADMPVKAYKAPPPPAPVFSWTGFYVGGQISANNVSNKASGNDPQGAAGGGDNDGPWGPLYFPMTQASVGVFGGYDYQIGRAVIGVEADYNRVFGSNNSLLPEGVYPGPGGVWSTASNWNASIRGRVGFLATERALLYGTAGVAFSKFSLRGGTEVTPNSPFFEINPNFGPGDVGGGTRAGWTVGAGIQYALDSNWSVRGEYRYTDYGTKRINYVPNVGAQLPSFIESQVVENRLGVGLSYKFGAPSAVSAYAYAGSLKASPMVAANWTGAYIGGQIGANALSTAASGNDPQGAAGGGDNSGPWGPLNFPMTQVSAGVFAGYDYQVGRAVVGIEGDYNRVFGSNESHISEDQYPGPGGIWSVKSNWNASIRGRLGFLATDRALVYGTAGVAFSRFDVRGGVENTTGIFYETYPNFGAGDIGGGTRVGWTAGGGLQYALDANWSMRGEYRYTDYGTKTLTYIPNLPGAVAATTDVKVTENRVSMGMSYKFANPSARMRDYIPVVIATWTGVYVGVQGGANALGTKSGGFDAGGLDGNAALTNYSLSYPMTQTSVGAFAGYDYQVNRVVVGVEGDYNRVFGSNHSYNAEDQYPGFSGITKVNAQWNASVRGRLGFLPTDRMLVYGTAGVAFAAFDMRYGIEGIQVPLFGDVNVAGNTRTGWTAGAGMQYAFDTNWSMRGEYRYTEYGTNRVNYDHIGASYVDTKMTENRASVGIAYKFASPVTAKY